MSRGCEQHGSHATTFEAEQCARTAAEPGLDCLRCVPPAWVAAGGMKDHMDQVHRAVEPERVLFVGGPKHERAAS